MMLAYQPVRALSTLVLVAKQGLSASRILPIIDQKNEIKDNENAQNLNINQAKIEFKNINFAYEKNEEYILNSINLNFEGKNDIFSWS